MKIQERSNLFIEKLIKENMKKTTNKWNQPLNKYPIHHQKENKPIIKTNKKRKLLYRN